MRLDRNVEEQVPELIATPHNTNPIRSIQQLWLRNRLVYCEHGPIRIVDTMTGEDKCSPALEAASGSTDAFAISADQNLLICMQAAPGLRSPFQGQGVLLWDFAGDKKLAHWVWPRTNRYTLRCAAFSPDNKLLALPLTDFGRNANPPRFGVCLYDLRNLTKQK